jgi:hypothetical protein
MSFAVIKLIFGAIAVALLVVLFLVWRQLRGGRPSAAPAASEASGTKLSKLRKAAPTTAEPRPEAGPAPVRRRQLASFAEDERIASADDERPGAATASPVEPPAPVIEEPPAPVELSPEPMLEASSSDEQPFDEAVLARLESAFEAYQAGEMTLEAYAERLHGEQAVVDRRIEALGSEGQPAELEAARAAQESVRWCLDWVNEQDEAAREA